MTAYDHIFSKNNFEAVASKFLLWVGLLTFMEVLKGFPETRQKMHPPYNKNLALIPCLSLLMTDSHLDMMKHLCSPIRPDIFVLL